MVGLTIMLSRDGGLGGEVGGDFFFSAKIKNFFIKIFFFSYRRKKHFQSFGWGPFLLWEPRYKVTLISSLKKNKK